MDPALEKLVILQDRDACILSLKKEIDRLPSERKLRESKFQKLEADLQVARSRSKEIEVEKKTLQVEAESRRSQVLRYRTQQMQTRKNEEYAALSHEISVAEKAIASLEDREIALMEEAEALEPKISAAMGAYQAGKKQIEGEVQALDSREKNIRDQIAGLEKEREGLVDGIEKNYLALYERIFRSKGGSAIVAVQGNICSGCNMKMPDQTAAKVSGSAYLVHCPNCGRILLPQD